jgi:outer membrane protein assembly factor BamD
MICNPPAVSKDCPRTRRRRLGRLPAALTLAAALLPLIAGCKSGLGDDPILRLAAGEALTEGKQLMAQEKYARARRYLSHSFEVEPNSLAGREALLLLADSYYFDGGALNFVQAEAKYRDFLNRFPTSDQAAYAQFQAANSLAGRMEKADRDQSATEAALAAYQELIRLYPTSEYVAEARSRIDDVLDRLAEHEFVVGFFYFRRGLQVAAIDRFEELLERYPAYDERDKVLYYLTLACQRSLDPAQKEKVPGTIEQLHELHPESPYLGKLPAELLDGRITVGTDGTGGGGAL